MLERLTIYGIECYYNGKEYYCWIGGKKYVSKDRGTLAYIINSLQAIPSGI